MTTRINIRLGGNATVAKAADISDLTAKLDSIGVSIIIWSLITIGDDDVDERV